MKAQHNQTLLSHACSFGVLGLLMFPACIANTHDWMQETGFVDNELQDVQAMLQEAFGSKVTVMELNA